jgi:hypothetical protein
MSESAVAHDTSDVTHIDGEVVGKQDQSKWGVQVVRMQTCMTKQAGETILKGTTRMGLTD